MTTYERRTGSDAFVHTTAAALVRSMREDHITRLRTKHAPESGAEVGGAGQGAEREGRETPRAGGGGGRTTSHEFESFRAADVERVRGLTDDLRRLMYPGFFDTDPLWDGELEAHTTRLCSRVARVLTDELTSALRYGRRPPQPQFEKLVPAGMPDAEFIDAAVNAFMSSLPEIRRTLGLDVQAAYDGDPAAEHTDEIILCYPGLEAITIHRLAHVLYCLGVPVLSRVMSEQAHSRTGIDIHPGAKIGESFFIDHGSATVIGETSVIGKQVKIYQGVTLGARSFPKDERGRVIRGIRRHPTIGDRVTIYAGAVILGGDTVIGDDCVIAGGVFVTSSVAPGHVVQQTRPEPVLKPTAGAASKGAAAGKSDLGWIADGAGI
jgi:serine O-acetyltransferase